MSYAGKGYGTNPQSNNYLNAQFDSFNVNTSVTPKTTRTCRGYNGFYPDFKPTIDSLSVTSSPAGSYSLVYINGSNFLPNGTTFVRFGNNYLPVTYYSSFSISFVVPLNSFASTYVVQVINIYNDNFSPTVNQSYPGNLNISNSVIYTIT